MKRVLIGYARLEKDVEMTNTSFSYAADYERLLVAKGEYPIYAYLDDLEAEKDGKIRLGWRNYIGYEGTVIDGNVGGKPGDATSYHQMNYDYILAELFYQGHDYIELVQEDYILRPEWGIELRDFCYDGKRNFTMKIVLKDSESICYMD